MEMSQAKQLQETDLAAKIKERLHAWGPYFAIWFLSWFVRFLVLYLVIPYDSWSLLPNSDEGRHAYFIEGLFKGEFIRFTTPQGVFTYSPVTPLVLSIPYLLFRVMGVNMIPAAVLAGILLASIWPVVTFEIASHLKLPKWEVAMIAVFSPIDLIDVLKWAGFSLEITILSIALFILLALKKHYVWASISLVPSLLAHRTGMLIQLGTAGMALILYGIAEFRYFQAQNGVDTDQEAHEQLKLRALFKRMAWLPYQIVIISATLILALLIFYNKLQGNLDSTIEFAGFFSFYWYFRFTGWVFPLLLIVGAWIFIKSTNKRKRSTNILIIVFPLTSLVIALIPFMAVPALTTRFLAASAAPFTILIGYALQRIEEHWSQIVNWILIIIIALFSVYMGIVENLSLRLA